MSANSKRTIPSPIPKQIDRADLQSKLDQILDYRLTYVSAPRGYAKTTALAAWMRRADFQKCWLTLSSEDDEPSQFHSLLLEAIQNSLSIHSPVDRGEALPSTGAQFISSLVALLSQTSGPEDEFVFVLDDYQTITDQNIHHAISNLIEHLPDQVRLVIISNVDPPLQFSKHRMRGELLEIGARQLRFSQAEMHALLKEAAGVPLTSEQLQAIEALTAGWPAGVTLLARSIEGFSDLEASLASISESGGMIAGFLFAELFGQLPERIAQFLLMISLLDRFSPSLCNAVRAERDSLEIIDYLRSHHLFTEALDQSGDWFSLHPMFQSFLQHRLLQTNEALLLPIHQRAAQWYETHAHFSSAIEHYLQAGDELAVCAVLEQHIHSFWSEGRHQQLLTWFSALSTHNLRKHPELMIYKALTFIMAGNLLLGDQVLAQIEVDMASTAEMKGMIASAKAYRAYFERDVEKMNSYTKQAIELLPEERHAWYMGLQIVMGNFLTQSGRGLEANQVYSDVIRAGNLTDNEYMVLAASVQMAINNWHIGNLGAAEQLCRRFTTEKKWERIPAAGTIFALQGELLRERNQLQDAQEYIERGLSLCGAAGGVSAEGWIQLAKLRLSYSQQKFKQARQSLSYLDDLCRMKEVPAWLHNGVSAWGILVAIQLGDIPEAENIVHQAQIANDEVIQLANFDLHHAYASYLLETGMLTKNYSWITSAQESFQKLRAAAKDNHWRGHYIRSLTMLCRCELAQGKTEDALATLTAALKMAYERGYYRVFLDSDPIIFSLLEELLQRNILIKFGTDLLQSFENEHQDSQFQPAYALDPLSAREMEVLRQLNTASTVTEIAAALSIAPSTARTHIRNIYGKLNVHTRIEAIKSGRELGLIK